jgi:hypothetical protein
MCKPHDNFAAWLVFEPLLLSLLFVLAAANYCHAYKQGLQG